MGKKFIVRPDVPKEPALIIKNQLLLSPGKWKGQNISKESIINGMKNTNWNDGKSNSVIYGHRTNSKNVYYGDPSPDMWVGYHSEPKYLTLSDGVEVEGMYADYHIYDTELASKLAYGGVRAGVSEGMEYDYYTGEIHRFINSSIVNDPACKNAFLNLSENEETNGMELSEPRFLNFSEDKPSEDKPSEDKPSEDKPKESEDKDEEKKSKSHTDERGLNGKSMENKDMEDKIKAFEDKISKVESTLEDISKKLSEKKEDEKPKEKQEDKPSEDKPKEPEKTSETTPKSGESKDPVVIESKDKPKEDDSKKNDNSEVVEAITKMGDRIVDGVKKAAEPQSAAQTNPNAVQSDMDDEKVTEKLVEQYSKLHPETSQNE